MTAGILLVAERHDNDSCNNRLLIKGQQERDSIVGINASNDMATNDSGSAPVFRHVTCNAYGVLLPQLLGTLSITHTK